MNLTPPPGDAASLADHHPHLIRRVWNQRRKSPAWHGDPGFTASASPPRTGPPPAQTDEATAPEQTIPPELASAAALLALLLGRH